MLMCSLKRTYACKFSFTKIRSVYCSKLVTFTLKWFKLILYKPRMHDIENNDVYYT